MLQNKIARNDVNKLVSCIINGFQYLLVLLYLIKIVKGLVR